MEQHPLDKPEISANLFFPRFAMQGLSVHDVPFVDGTVIVDDEQGIVTGYRLYVEDDKTLPLVLFFHGNGEVAPDYDLLAQGYLNSGMNVIVFDYRGYGWSTGKPLFSRMLPDAAIALEQLPRIFQAHGIAPDVSLFVKGRSLGSAPAIYLAQQFPEKIKGLMLDSPYADAPSLFRRLNIPLPQQFQDDDQLPINNLRKMKTIELPLLIVHGEADQILPVQNAKDLYAASPSGDKTLIIVPKAGHNNILSYAMRQYFDALMDFVATYA